MARKKSYSQAEIAAALDVDRTTVRAWGLAGMPFSKPPTRGKEASYSLSVAIYWHVWTQLRGPFKWPTLSPLHALAFAYASAVVFATDDDRAENRKECLSLFHRVPAPYFSKADSDAAINYALGYLDAAESVERTRKTRAAG